MNSLQEMKITDIVKNNTVMFSRLSLKSGTAFYRIQVLGFVYEFPVPVSDFGEGTFLRDDKALLFMRWITAAIKDKTIIRM